MLYFASLKLRRRHRHAPSLSLSFSLYLTLSISPSSFLASRPISLFFLTASLALLLLCCPPARPANLIATGSVGERESLTPLIIPELICFLSPSLPSPTSCFHRLLQTELGTSATGPMEAKGEDKHFTSRILLLYKELCASTQPCHRISTQLPHQ